MRRQLTAYLSEEEFHRLRDEANERGITLSRYVKERLFQSEGGSGLTFSDAALAAVKANHSGQSRVHGGNPETARPTIHHALAMINQFALSMLSHMPEIPEAQRKQALASGQRRHRGWRAEVEETLKRMEQSAPTRKATPPATESQHEFGAAASGAPPGRTPQTPTRNKNYGGHRRPSDHRDHHQ